MHFIAMLGFSIPGQQISYNVPATIASMLIAIAVVGAGLFIAGFGGAARPGWPPAAWSSASVSRSCTTWAWPR